MVPHYVIVASQVSKVVKYLCVAATTSLSLYSLLNEATLKADNPLQRKRLTPAGWSYLRGLVFLTLLTIGISAIADWADNRIHEDATNNFNANLDLKLKEKNRELEGAFKRVLDSLGTQVLGTAHQLEIDVSSSATKTVNSLVEQNKASSRQIQDIQDGLVLSSQQTSAKIVSASEKDSEAVFDVEKSLTEAPTPISSFWLEFATEVPRPLSIPDLSAWTLAFAASKASEREFCAKSPHSQYLNDPRNLCDVMFHENKSWEETHELAKALYPGVGYTAYLTLTLKGFGVSLTDGIMNCSWTPHRVTSEPCLKQQIHTNESGLPGQYVPAFLEGASAISDGQVGASIGVDGPEGLSKLGTFFARDAEVRYLTLSYCGDGPPLSSKPASEQVPAIDAYSHGVFALKDKAPKSISVTIHEEAAQPIIHTYEFAASPAATMVNGAFCVEIPYRR